MRKEFVLITEKNNKIRISCFGLENIQSSPCLILVHGFKGFKDWGFWPITGKELADNGFFVLSFNFSHNGVCEDPMQFTELEKFAENTFSLEISELNQVIDSYKNEYFGPAFRLAGGTKNWKIGLLGHSRGGAISILTAAEREDVGCVAVWASVSRLDRYSQRQKEKWKKEGFFEVLNTRTNQIMRLNVSLLEDIEKNSGSTLNIEKAVRGLKKPLLIIHGDQDLAVRTTEGEQLYNWSDKNMTTFYIIKSAGHTFNIVHPFEGKNKKFNEVLEQTIKFFKSNLVEDIYARN